MGRISDTSLYPFDTAITPNDYIIGTDGDNLNATKNYKVATMLGYLGNMFNLQSQDLYYTYNAVASTSVGVGEISSNNYQDGTILTSGVTNLYVSKLTALGALVDTYLNAIATDNLTLIVMDLSAPQNYLVFNLTGSSDVDANTIDLAGTVGESNGELISGRSIGFKLTAGGGVSGNFVTLDTTQTITASKTFSGIVNFTGFLTSVTNLSSTTATSNLLIMNRQGASIPDSIGSNKGFALVGDFLGQPHYFLGKILSTGSTGTTFSTIDGGFLDFSALTEQRKYTFPNATGTIALTSDIPAAVTISDTVYGASWNGNTTDGASKNALYDKIETLTTLNTAQTITGGKTFSSSATFSGGLTSNGQINIGSNAYLDINSSNPHVAFALESVASTNNASRPIIYWNNSSQFSFSKANSASRASLDINSLTAHRVYTLPNKAMTFAGTDDVPDVASQAEAEAGTDNTKIMTPLRVQQAINQNAVTIVEGSISNPDFTSGAVDTTLVSAQGAGTIIEVIEAAVFVSNWSATGAVVQGAVRYITADRSTTTALNISGGTVSNINTYAKGSAVVDMNELDARNDGIRLRLTNTASETTTGTIYYRVTYRVWTPV